MRKILEKLCEWLEKKLYSELTWQELSEELDKAYYLLEEAKGEISYLKSQIK